MLGGGAYAAPQVGDQVSADIARAELIAFPILFLLSLVVFRSAVAALLPLVVGGTTILLSFLVIRVVNDTVNPMSIYALNLINGLALGLGIDYSLFMVSRFREELAAGRGTEAALNATLRTAGRTVAWSGVTVAAALASLLIFRLRFLYSMGVGGGVGALIAVGVSLTLLPALLGVLGERVNALGLKRWKEAIAHDARGERSGFWYRHSQRVMRHPVPVATGAAVLLLAHGRAVHVDQVHRRRRVRAPARPLGARGRRRAAHGVPAQRQLAGLRGDPARDAARTQVEAYARRLPHPVAPPRVGAARIDLIAPGPALGERAKALVRDVRAVPAPFDAKVGGQTAAFLDQQASLRAHLAPALAVLAATTLIILFLMTGSVVLPVKALIMNLLTLSAAFGLVVLVFQDGHLLRPARLHEPARDRVLAARAAVRRRVRALHRLRRVPARAHQGAARPRAAQRGGGGARAPADGADRHVRRAADDDRHRLLRHLEHRVHQAARASARRWPC